MYILAILPLKKSDVQSNCGRTLEAHRHGVRKVPELKVADHRVRTTVFSGKGQGIRLVDVAGYAHVQALDVSPAGDGRPLDEGADHEAEDGIGRAVGVRQGQLVGLDRDIESHLSGVKRDEGDLVTGVPLDYGWVEGCLVLGRTTDHVLIERLGADSEVLGEPAGDVAGNVVVGRVVSRCRKEVVTREGRQVRDKALGKERLVVVCEDGEERGPGIVCGVGHDLGLYTVST